MKKKQIVITAAGIIAILCVGCLALTLLTDTTPAPEATATTAAEATEPPAPMDTPAPTATRMHIPPFPTDTATAMPTKTPTPEIFVTMDGYDPASDSIIDPINLWIDYNDRAAGIAAEAHHGDKVKLIQREGDGVLVETAGVQGWVTYYFIKELK